ncbi:MAG: SH3 domain-containing protein [Anaerolineales bacterium]|nr:SH3 domain-containing protein [Anaerolineales bacterium]
MRPIAGTTTTQINVRTGTNTASDSLGVIPAFSQIQIIGKDSSGNWFQIIYETGAGWVRAEFVQVDASAEIPVLEIESGIPLSMSGVVKSGINVRSGPGTQYESIGVLTQNDVVAVIGKDSNGTWMQIKFGNDTGWVAEEFLQIENVEEIPVVGVSQTTEVAPVVIESAMPSTLIAIEDGDSLQSPAIKIVLSENKFLQIQGSVSAPQGDVEDWFEFSSNTPRILIESTCSTSDMQMELWQTENLIEVVTSPCNNKVVFNLLANKSYTLRILQSITNESQYTNYTLKLQVLP